MSSSGFTDLLGRLFRELCPACGGTTHGGFCATCAAELPRVADPCSRCGLARPVARCPRAGAPWHVGAVIAPYSYAEPLDHYVLALKYTGARALGRAFGLLLAPHVRHARPDVDALVAVPLHPTRLRQRGYNQAVEIARTLGRELGLPLQLRGIERLRAGPSQTSGSATQRRASVAAAFRVTRDVTGRRIGIVDDVLTTGATVNALAGALLAAGAAGCVAVAAARTPES
ncbi:MAG TPA: ComF family protein [Gammaproteobacteria bacterium]|jgi:ComF family protein|nr:ComF family protein [Gammaproteobacteria bacterium]